MEICQEGSWLNEGWFMNDNFSHSKEKFHSVYNPLKDISYEKEKVWNPEKEENFYHVVGPEGEIIITKRNMIRSFGEYKSDFETLRKENNKLPEVSAATVEMYKKTLRELKDMEEMIKDLNNDDV
jgi:hypothetical protein